MSARASFATPSSEGRRSLKKLQISWERPAKRNLNCAAETASERTRKSRNDPKARPPHHGGMSFRLPLQFSYLNAFQIRQEHRQIRLPLRLNDLRSRIRHCLDKILIVVLAKIEWILRTIYGELRVLPVVLIAQQVVVA